MRTNPFFDAWLFLIGATDDHRALGVFQYVMVALFWALLFASAWIAFKNWSENPEQRRASHAITWVCRLLVGAQSFQGCLWKLPLPSLAASNIGPGRWASMRRSRFIASWSKAYICHL